MNKVIIINLNGVAYQLEENGYEALRAYLDTASRRLEGNPDRDEIIADIEQAIADKFRALLGANKTVVATREVEAVVAEMGPVEDASGAPAAGAKAASAQEPAGVRRLYRIHDGAMVAGVCNGIAVHFGIDVTIVRVLFVILALLWGLGGLLYIIMAFLVPVATTPAEKAAAQGIPSTAQEFIRRARAGYYGGLKTFGDKRAYREWKRKFRQEMRGWGHDLQRDMHRNAYQWAHNWRQHCAEHPIQMFGWWIVVPVVRLLSLLVTLVCLVAVISLLSTGAIFGIFLPVGIPIWLGLVLLIFAFQVVAWPLRAMRQTLYFGCGGGPMYSGWVHLWNCIAWLVFAVFVIWFAGRHSAEVHDALRDLPREVHRAVDAVRDWWAQQK